VLLLRLELWLSAAVFAAAHESTSGPRLPTCAVQQVGSWLGYSGHQINVVVAAAHGPGCVETLRGMTAPGVLRLVVTLTAKKLKNSSSARQYDQISSRFHTASTHTGR
jgi:hypothetical protein